MSIYTQVTSVKGDRYMKDKRFIAKAAVPPKILAKLEVGREVSDERVHVTPPIKKCIFCSKETKLSRIINSETIYLCENDYYSKTVGQVVQKVREFNDEENSQVEEKL